MKLKRLPHHDNGADETPLEKFEEISLYKITRQIHYNNMIIISKFPKVDKYFLGSKLEECITNVLVGIASTYREQNLHRKHLKVRKLAEDSDQFLITMRLIGDLNLVSKDRYADQITLTISLIKQITNWRKSISEALLKTKRNS